MALPEFKKDMRIISVLSDRPNAASNEHLDGLQFKQKFDEGGEALKEYINETLIPFLAGSEAAASLGIGTISGISEATNIQQALEALKFAIDNTTSGAIPDGSLSGEKLLPGTITNREMAREAIGKENVKKKVLGAEEIADNGIEGYNLADKIIANRHLGLLVVEDGNVADKTLSGGKIKDGTLSANLYAKNSVQEPTIAPNAVTRAKLASDAKSKGVAVTLPASGWADGAQTVAVEGVMADNNLLVSAAPASREAWNDAEIYCSAQAAGSLTFTCGSIPAENITANVVILI